MAMEGPTRASLPRRFPLIVILHVLLWGIVAVASAASPKAFSVEDAIEMDEFMEPAPASRTGVSPNFLESPNGEWYAVVTRKGDVTRNAIVYKLAVFRAKDALALLTKESKRAIDMTTVAVVTTKGSRPGIERLQWIDDSHVAYIERNNDEASSVVASSTQDRSKKTLVSGESEVVDYSVSRDGETVVFAMSGTRPYGEAFEKGYVVERKMMTDVMVGGAGKGVLKPLAFYMKRMATSETRRLDVPEDIYSPIWDALPAVRRISMSPDGMHATVFTMIRNVPQGWNRYDFIQDLVRGNSVGTEGSGGTDAAALAGLLDFAYPSGQLKQYWLVDTVTLKTRALIDSPTGYSGWDQGAFWTSDSSRVVVSPTYLPLEGVEGEEFERRRGQQWTASVDVHSGELVRLAGLQDGPLPGLREIGSGTICSIDRAEPRGIPAKCFRFTPQGSWVDVSLKEVRPLWLSITEAMNSAPQISAYNAVLEQGRTITDQNPQLRTLKVGLERELVWKDKYGREYTGGMVLPPDFRSDRRYPLVIQTTGFTKGEFLVDGGRGMSSAYAARPFASRGIIVLVMPGVSGDVAGGAAANWFVDSELQKFRWMTEGAIDKLVADGFVDRERVGIVGFSFGGMLVLHTITFSDHHFAAATICHSSLGTPFSYASLYGISYPAGMNSFEQPDIVGSRFFGSGIEKWVERSPAFHLDRVSAPLRIEHIGENSFPEYWDVYANLKRNQRPVEMIHIPNGGHQLEPPLSRMASQEGNVDWFSYWLLGEEDPRSEKADQYRRWDAMKARVVTTEDGKR